MNGMAGEEKRQGQEMGEEIEKGIRYASERSGMDRPSRQPNDVAAT